MSFNIVSLGVNHGIAHALGAKFHIPHGRANAILLPHVMRYNAELPEGFSSDESQYTRAAKKLSKIAQRLGIRSTNTRVAVCGLCDKIAAMERECGVPATLKEAGVSRVDYEAQREAIIESALKDACTATNPRVMDHDGVEAILRCVAKF